MKRKIKLSGSVEGLRSPLLRIFPAPVHNTRQGPPPSRAVILHAVPTRFYAALFALRQQWPQLKRAFKRLRRVFSTMNCLIPISDEGAAKARISGGKGANSHLLHRFSEMQAGFQVPSTSVLTTRLFTQLVMPRVRSQVRALGSLSGSDPHNPQREALCREIEEEILALSLPPELEKRLGEEFERLGSDVAVRSSATCEDTSRYSAAGQGYTALHQTTLEGVISSIKKVWASLYSVGFTLYREESGYAHEKARMAVLLQAFVNSRAAGVVHSFDQGTGRPGYCISAQPGLGEGVVQPVGSVDHWFVGLLCEENDILERRIADKQRRIVIRPEGGTMEEGVCITDASLEDEMVLKIARVARSVRRHYVEERHAKDIDIEFAVDGQGPHLSPVS